MILPILCKELQTFNWRRSLVLQLLLLGVLLVLSIGQLGEVEKQLGLEVDGLTALLDTLNSSLAYRQLFSSNLAAVGFHAACLVFCFYAGLPHVLQFFTSEKQENNLGFLFVAMSRPRPVMLAVWLAATLRVLVMTLINGAVLLTVYISLGFHFTWDQTQLSSFLAVFIAVSAVLMLANAVVWATHGSETVLKVFRIAALAGIVAAVPAVNMLRLNFSGLDFRYTAASLLLWVMAALVSRLLTRLFRKEKTLTA